MQIMTSPNRTHPVASLPDPRWDALTAVRDARASLGLRDRTIAVLRGLLTLVPVASWADRPIVHAANKTLQDRCDGMDERTLRRHLTVLVQTGLIRRHQSPNRKRYVIRDESGTILLAYGFDLAPLRDAVGHLTRLAAEERRVTMRIRALRAILRDHLYHLSLTDAENLDPYRRLLRRKIGIEMLEAAISDLAAQRDRLRSQVETPFLTVSDGQNDRHIQSSEEESLESEGLTIKSDSLPTLPQCQRDAPDAMSFAADQPRTWSDMVALADLLGPGLGLDSRIIGDADRYLGKLGRTLAILGLTQAYPQIKEPGAYLRTLVRKAKNGALDLQRMFASLTSRTRHIRFPAGNPALLHHPNNHQ